MTDILSDEQALAAFKAGKKIQQQNPTAYDGKWHEVNFGVSFGWGWQYRLAPVERKLAECWATIAPDGSRATHDTKTEAVEYCDEDLGERIAHLREPPPATEWNGVLYYALEQAWESNGITGVLEHLESIHYTPKHLGAKP